jgi:hypothetical protein
VTPGTSSGSPAASQQVRATSPACGRVQVDPVEQRAQDVRTEVGRVFGGQPAAAPADRRADRFDDEGVCHGARLPS